MPPTPFVLNWYSWMTAGILSLSSSKALVNSTWASVGPPSSSSRGGSSRNPLPRRCPSPRRRRRRRRSRRRVLGAKKEGARRCLPRLLSPCYLLVLVRARRSRASLVNCRKCSAWKTSGLWFRGFFGVVPALPDARRASSAFVSLLRLRKNKSQPGLFGRSPFKGVAMGVAKRRGAMMGVAEPSTCSDPGSVGSDDADLIVMSWVVYECM